jgi:RNase E specificity factor CsrD
MEHAEAATRNAVLQGSNSWAVYDDTFRRKGAATCAGVR